MISKVFCVLFLLMRSCASVLDTTENVSRLDAQFVEYRETRQEPTYDQESTVLLPRVFAFLQPAIDAIGNDTCRDQWRSVSRGLRNLTGWAVRFYDASGKVPTGVLAGSVYQFGNFDECLDLSSDEGGTPSADIRGQYCLAEVEVEVPETYLSKNGSAWEAFRDTQERNREPIRKFYWGICVPAGCTVDDIEDIVRRILVIIFSDSRLKLTVRISETSCYSGKTESVDAPDIIYACAILFMFSMILGGTILHIVSLSNKNKTSNGTFCRILICFSLISNLKKLFTSAHVDKSHLHCICGIRFISMFFIIAGHTLMYKLNGSVLNRKFFEEAVTKIENSIFINNVLLVDTFLLLSSFLFCYILLRELDKRKSVNFLLLYVIRYIRLTPAYSVIVGLYATWLTRLDRGPLWSVMRYEKEKCLASWWTNLLYINNYVNTDKLCMFQSWYLAVDTQLFILAPIVLYPLWKWRKIGKYPLTIVTIISIAIPFAVTLLNNLDPTLMLYTREIKDITTNSFFKNSYIKTHMRAQSYCVGLVYGYVAYRIQADKYELSKKIVRFGWLCATLSLLLSMFSITIFYNVRKDFTTIEAAVYAPLHRLLWCVGVGWIIIACITDNAGPIRSFLECDVFVVLSRLTYSAYLVNGLVELHSMATMRSPQYVDHFVLLGIILSHVMLTFGGALLLSIMFESPILALEQIFLRKKQSSNSEPESKKTSISNTQHST